MLSCHWASHVGSLRPGKVLALCCTDRRPSVGCKRSLGSTEGSSVLLQAIGASERVMYYLDKPVAAQIQDGDCVPSWSGKVSKVPFVPLCSLLAVALLPGQQLRSAARAAAWPLKMPCHM